MESARGRPRIVVFAPHYASYALHLATALAASADVLLFLEQGNKSDEIGPSAISGVDRLRIVEFKSRGRAARLAASLQIVARVARFRPDVINIQEEEGRFTAWITALIKPFAPILLTVHDPNPHTGADATYAAANARFQRAIRSAAAGFHVHGAFCRSELVAAVGSDRPIFVSQHGVLFETSRSPSHSPGPEPERGRFLLFGRMEAYKGLDVLLDAFASASASGVLIRLVLAGRGPELARLQNRAANLANIEVINTFLEPDDVRAEMQRADAIVVPYLNATQSGVIAAAFGNGRPVIASRVGGLVDAVREGENGLLVPPGDASALAAALLTFAKDDALREHLGRGAVKAQETEFAWSGIALEMLQFMRRAGLVNRRIN